MTATTTRKQEAIETAIDNIKILAGNYKFSDAGWQIIRMRLEIIATAAETDFLNQQIEERKKLSGQ